MAKNRFVYVTIGVEVKKGEKVRLTNAMLEKLQADLNRHTETVALPLCLPGIKTQVVPEHDMAYGVHVHDNDGSCTSCYGLYNRVHEDRI